jgi:hypothetical protein
MAGLKPCATDIHGPANRLRQGYGAQEAGHYRCARTEIAPYGRREAGLKPCATDIHVRLAAFAKATAPKKPDTTDVRASRD